MEGNTDDTNEERPSIYLEKDQSVTTCASLSVRSSNMHICELVYLINMYNHAGYSDLTFFSVVNTAAVSWHAMQKVAYRKNSSYLKSFSSNDMLANVFKDNRSVFVHYWGTLSLQLSLRDSSISAFEHSKQRVGRLDKCRPSHFKKLNCATKT